MQIVQILPAGSRLPPLSHLLVLAVAVAGVALALRRTAPRVTDRVVVSFAPWMVAGSSGYVLQETAAIPDILQPFLASPAVYVSVAIVAGAVWAATAAAELPADRFRFPSVPSVLAVSGGVVTLVMAGWVLAVGMRDGLSPVWPTVGLAVAIACAAAVWAGLREWFPQTRMTGAVGGLCIFGHALDGISTAIGIDVLGFGERSPLSRVIIEFAAGLPTASVIGSGWLFVLAKLALAAAVVVLLSGYVREEPTEGYLLLGAVAAVGLGPGAHNLLLFTVVSP